jgi:AraC-like DNA-binding protein
VQVFAAKPARCFDDPRVAENHLFSGSHIARAPYRLAKRFWRIPAICGANCSGSVRLCYKNARFVSSGRLAEAAGMSLRQFSRIFRSQTGSTPARVVERLRADLARGRIETTAEPVERIAEAVGFGAAENMRRAFIRIYGRPPQSVRRAIRT